MFRTTSLKINKFSILDPNPLLIAISSSECERAFSSINNLVTTKRNALSPTHILSLMFIYCVGPPVKTCNPDSYVLSWIRDNPVDTGKDLLKMNVARK